MKILVDKLPERPHDCLFYSERISSGIAVNGKCRIDDAYDCALKYNKCPYLAQIEKGDDNHV